MNRSQSICGLQTGHSARLALILGLFIPAAVSAQSFEVVDLGAGGAMAIANNHSTAGWSQGSGSQRSPFSRCEGCSIQDLGYLPYGSDGSATAVSPNGQFVAGYSGISFNYNEGSEVLDVVTGTEVTQGFFWRDGQMLETGALYNPAIPSRRHGHSEAHGVNDLGQVVGFSVIMRAGSHHAFIWEEGTGLLDLGGGAEDASISRAFAINNSSQIAGDMAHSPLEVTDWDFRRAALWQGGSRQDLGTLGGHNSSSARDINEAGQLVGWSGIAEAELGSISWSHAVRWQAGMIQDLGTLPGDESSQALAINDNAQITGWSGSTSGVSRAFLWQCGEMYDLNALIPQSSGWQLIEARDINNSGRVVGLGINAGVISAFMLVPSAGQQAWAQGDCTVPGPGSEPAVTEEAEGEPVNEPAGENVPVEEPAGESEEGDVDEPAAGPEGESEEDEPLFNGVAPDPSLGLNLNNIGVLVLETQQIRSCVNIRAGSQPASHNGMSRIAVTLDILSMDEGAVRVSRARTFNAQNALTETGEAPSCSGVFDLTTNIYEDVVQVGRQTYRASFELYDGVALELRLRDLELLD